MTSGGRVYIGTFDGFFEVRQKEPGPGTIQRVTKNGKTINVLRYNQLAGILRGFEIKKAKISDVEMEFFVLLIQADKLYQIDLQVSSSSTFYFISRLVQCDIKKPMTLKIFANVENGKKKTVIVIYQEGSKDAIKGLWTKDHPNGCPNLKKVMFKGKEQWDDTDRNEYVKKFALEKIVPQIEAPIAVGAASGVGAEAPHVSDGPKDDTELLLEEVETPEWLKNNQPPPPTTPPPGKQ